MDSIDFDKVRAEKAKALRRFNRFRRIGRVFRAAEVCLALLFAFWTFTCLPFAVQISGALFSRIIAVISSPFFVFLLGNSIVVVLLTKSSDQTTSAAARAEIYKAFIRSVENRSKPSFDDGDITEEIVCDDTQVIVTDLNSNSNPNLNVDSYIPHVKIDSSGQNKVYGRSKSDVESPNTVGMKRSLQRSETEKWSKKRTEIENDESNKKNYPEDNMSNEEFQKTIEAFIAKQRMFRRQEESLALVSCP